MFKWFRIAKRNNREGADNMPEITTDQILTSRDPVAGSRHNNMPYITYPNGLQVIGSVRELRDHLVIVYEELKDDLNGADNKEQSE